MPKDNGGNSTRELIVQTAKKLFFERGIDGISTRDLASKSYVARNSVRYYFKTKKDIYRAVSDDILYCLVDVTVEKIQVQTLTWCIMSFVFWYRFYQDGQFRNYCLQCIGKIEVNESDFHCIHEFMHQSFNGKLSYEDFVAQNYLALVVGWSIYERLMEYYASHIDCISYQNAAADELLLTLRLFGIPDDLICTRINAALEILPSLNIPQMGAALG